MNKENVQVLKAQFGMFTFENSPIIKKLIGMLQILFFDN